MPFGAPWIGGDVPDPNEKRSFLENLFLVAGAMQGGEPLGMVGNIMESNLQQRRQRGRQEALSKILGQQMPGQADLFGQLGAAGVGPEHLIAPMFKQIQDESDRKRFMAAIQTMPAGPVRQALELSQAAGVAPTGGDFLKAFGVGGKSTIPSNLFAQQMYLDELKKTDPGKAAEAQAAYERAIADQERIAGARTTATVTARQNVEGPASMLEGPTKQMLVRWGFDPHDNQLPPHIVDQAADAVNTEKLRLKVTADERSLKRAVNESFPLMDRLDAQVKAMQAKGMDLSDNNVARQYGGYEMMTKPGAGTKIAGSWLPRGFGGKPPPEFMQLFNIIGQLRTRLVKPYQSGMRAYQWLLQSQQHLPAEGAPIEGVTEAVSTLRPLLVNMKRELAPEEDPSRQTAIHTLLFDPATRQRRIDPDTGRPMATSHAEYLADKLLLGDVNLGE